LPTAVTPAGTSRVTTLPAPISALSPILTPDRIIETIYRAAAAFEKGVDWKSLKAG